MSITCFLVLLVALGACFSRKCVFDAYEGVRCRFYFGGLSQRWNTPPRGHFWKTGFFTSLPVALEVRAIFVSFCGIIDLLIVFVPCGEPTPGDCCMHDEVSP